MGIAINETEAKEILSAVRQKSIDTKRNLNDGEIMDIYSNIKH